VPGEGNSSPVVWDDSVLLTTALTEDDPPQLAVVCYDRSDGTLRWRAGVGRAEGQTHSKNGYASATVATDGRAVFAFFGSTGLFCYDLEGEQVWHADLGALDHKWGTASSPVLFADSVIQLCDCAEGSYLAAFDKRTGRPRWRTARSSQGCWTTPVLVDVEAGDKRRVELVVNGGVADGADGGMVTGYDPDDGRRLWWVRGTKGLVTPTILVGRRLIYSASGRNGPLIAIRPGGRGDVTQTHVVWKYRVGGPYIPSGVLYRNRLYVVGDHGQLSCYNAGDGKTIWRSRLHGSFSASLVAADGRIYATSERGVVYVLAAADSFQLLQKNALGERCLATPAVAGGELFIRTAGSLYCFANQDQLASRYVSGE
jgi:outer membrane protein assembly factor BamB